MKRISVILRCRWLVALVAATALSAQTDQSSIAHIESLLRSHQVDAALVSAKAALRNHPDDFRVWTLEGLALSLSGRNSEALSAFQKALNLAPGNPAALRGAAQLLYQKDDSRALPLLQKILNADPNDPAANEMFAALSQKQGNCQAAIPHFRASAPAMNAHPASLEAYGDCLVQTHQLQDAIPVFTQLAQLLPQRAYPKYDLAVILVMAKQDQSAIQVLQPLLDAPKVDPDALSLASEAYEALGNTPKAVSLLRQAIVENPTDADYYAEFAGLCMRHDSFRVGIDMLNAGLQRIPRNPALYISRGMLYAQIAQYDNAEKDFRAAEQLDAKQALSSYALGITQIQMEKMDQALVTIRAELKKHPDSALLHYALAQVLLNLGATAGSPEFGEAMKSAELALKDKPDLAPAHDLLASLYMRNGQTQLAILQSRLALATDPSDQQAIYHLIIALRHSGQQEEIQSLVKRLSELQNASRQEETDRKRYKLIEQAPASAQ